VAVLGAIVRARQFGGASFEAGLDSAFAAAGAVTLISAAFTGIWLVKSSPQKSLPSRHNQLIHPV